MAKQGDRVLVITREEDYEGTLMPKEKEFLVLKLNSGYNIGIDRKRVHKIRVLEKRKAKKAVKPKKAKLNKKLPKISILHTGGTIASKVDYETGGVMARFTPEEILDMFPELKKIANIDSRLVKNMWSEDIRFEHYNILAKEVAKEVRKGVNGVIITHGTDTMHYTSAALSFMLQDLPIPVILVGAQRSSDRGSSDAAINLISAAIFIANTKFAEIAICMHETIEDKKCVILQGTKTRKMHSSSRDAFKTINTKPWAVVDYDNKSIRFLRGDYKKKGRRQLKTKLLKNKKVGLIKTHTNMSAEQFKCYTGYEGLVIEGTGLGHAPINKIDEITKENEQIFKTLKNLTEKGTAVVMTTQTVYGQIDMNVYSTGRKLQEIGVIGNYCDMTAETAFIKLAWLLSNYKKNKIKDLFEENLVGEISKKVQKVD